MSLNNNASNIVDILANAKAFDNEISAHFYS